MGIFDFLKQKKVTAPAQKGVKKSVTKKESESEHNVPQKESPASASVVTAKTIAKPESAVETQQKREEPKKEGSKEMVKDALKILLRPLVTEKSEAQKNNDVYFFEVGMETNKDMIKSAVKKIYGVKVLNVNIINRKGKEVRFGRFFGRQKDRKRAMVTIQKGQHIEFS